MPIVLYTDVDGQCDKLVTETSPVYHRDHPPKLTALDTISRSIDMVGVYQNLNGLHNLTMPLSGMVCLPWACYGKPTYQI